MPVNKNALIRYKTIDNCLRNPYRRWTLDDLVDACSQALYEMEGITKGVSVRTVQADIQMMRSDKLGYNAPIEVYDHKYYRYASRDYSIFNMPLSTSDLQALQETVDMLRQLEDFEQFSEMADVVSRLQDKLAITRNGHKPIVNFDNVPNLKGLKLLNPLYNHIAHRHTRTSHSTPAARRSSSSSPTCSRSSATAGSSLVHAPATWCSTTLRSTASSAFSPSTTCPTRKTLTSTPSTSSTT